MWDAPASASPWPNLAGGQWTPTRTSATVVCVRDGRDSSSVMVSYPDLASAERAAAEVCSLPNCRGVHYVVATQPGHIHVEPGARDVPPMPPSLAAALAACYPRRNGHPHHAIEVNPAAWPTPPEYNVAYPPRARPLA